LYEMEKRMNKLYEESAMTGDENQLLKAAEIQDCSRLVIFIQ